MELEVLRVTPQPEQLVCEAARGDYYEGWNGNASFGELMDSISPADDAPDGVIDAVDVESDSEESSDVLARKVYALCDRLLSHGHYGPFEHPQLTITVKGVSRSLMAQLTRHRHVTFDIQSMRYVEFEDANTVDIPELDTANPAGRNAELESVYADMSDETLLSSRHVAYQGAIEQAIDAYNDLLEMGVAPENARMVLPIGTKVNMTFSLNPRTLLHVADMRAAADAQWEIRDMTDVLLDEVANYLPATMHIYNEKLRDRKNRLAP